MQLAAPRDDKLVGAIRVLHAHGHVVLQLVVQARPDLAAGEVLSLTPGKGAVVDGKRHAHRRLFHLDRRQRPRIVRIGQRVADAGVLDARYGDDAAGRHLGFGHALQVFEGVDLRHLAHLNSAFGIDAYDWLAAAHRTTAQAPDRDLADVAAVFKRRHEQLCRAIHVHQRRRQVLEDGVKQRLEAWAEFISLQAGTAVQPNGVDDRKLGLLVAGTQVDKQVKRPVYHMVWPGGRAVYLVHHDDGLEPFLQRLAQHKARLRHGAFDSVHQQQHAIHHVHDAFDLAAKVGVTGSVDNVDRDALVLDTGVLGQDRDAALAFQVVGVHHALNHELILAEHLGLAQHAVYQGCLTMIDVSDDGDIANVGPWLEAAQVFDNHFRVTLGHKFHLVPCYHMLGRQKTGYSRLVFVQCSIPLYVRRASPCNPNGLRTAANRPANVGQAIK